MREGKLYFRKMPVHLKDDTAVRRPFQLKDQFHPRKYRAVIQYPDVLQNSLEAAGMQAAYIPSQKPAFFITSFRFPSVRKAG